MAVTELVQLRPLAAIINNGRSSFYNYIIYLSHRQSKCFVSGGRNCDKGCLHGDYAATVDRPGQFDVTLL